MFLDTLLPAMTSRLDTFLVAFHGSCLLFMCKIYFIVIHDILITKAVSVCLCDKYLNCFFTQS